MTALVITDVFFPDTVGGAGRTARKLADGLAREMDVVVVTRNEGGRLRPKEMAGGLEIHRFFVDRSHPRRFFSSAVKNSVTLIAQLSRARRFDRLVISQPLSGIGALPLLRSVPAVYTFHSPWSEEYRTQIGSGTPAQSRQQAALWARRLAERALVRRCRRVMVHSRYMGRLLRRIHGVSWDRIASIPGGVDLERFRPGPASEARERLGLPQDAEILLTVRNLMPRMGLSELLSAFQVLRANRERAYLVIAGDGPLRDELHRQISKLGLASCVQLAGRVADEDLPDFYRAADVFVLATTALEGFGLVTVEALASGIPVIATPVGASPEILTQLDGSLVAKSAAGQDIARALQALLSRPLSERQALARCGRELCERLYAWPSITQAFNQLVRSVG
ncbi:MAG TPA: glycosyltransferase family 4 protein [Chloroflexota bacterium]|nr:glycosyltransferase family 4 protein [Chloroflexota bacterium]